MHLLQRNPVMNGNSLIRCASQVVISEMTAFIIIVFRQQLLTCVVNNTNSMEHEHATELYYFGILIQKNYREQRAIQQRNPREQNVLFVKNKTIRLYIYTIYIEFTKKKTC